MAMARAMGKPMATETEKEKATALEKVIRLPR
jgi:hypothetical protein